MRLSLQKRSIVLFSHILESASRGRLLTWTSVPLISNDYGSCVVDESRFQVKLRDSQVMAEFHSKLRTAEDLIAKLGYSLREITDHRDS